MKYKRLHRISKAKSTRFFCFFDNLLKDYGNELTWKTLHKDAKTDYLNIKARFEKKKFGLHFINDIDAFLKKHRLTLNQLFSLIYTPHLENMVNKTNTFLDLISKTKS